MLEVAVSSLRNYLYFLSPHILSRLFILPSLTLILLLLHSVAYYRYLSMFFFRIFLALSSFCTILSLLTFVSFSSYLPSPSFILLRLFLLPYYHYLSLFLFLGIFLSHCHPSFSVSCFALSSFRAMLSLLIFVSFSLYLFIARSPFLLSLSLLCLLFVAYYRYLSSFLLSIISRPVVRSSLSYMPSL